MNFTNLKTFLNERADLYNRPGFINDDPISIPHRFSEKQDIEIAAFFAALLAWGTRTGIINSCTKLFHCMDNAPYDFITHFTDNDFTGLKKFVHRTFNGSDLYFLFCFLKDHYQKNKTLETAFSEWLPPHDTDTEHALNGFYRYMFKDYAEEKIHVKKHIAAPLKKSACKRLNMFLRWMVRSDNRGVDFGLWKKIKPAQLVCPLDVHVARVARKLFLLERKQNDWLAAQELTAHLKSFDPVDPVKYDFALFGLGAVEKF